MKKALAASLISMLFLCSATCQRKGEAVSGNKPGDSKPSDLSANTRPIVGAERLGQYLQLLENKRVALVVNHSSLVGKTHLADTLLRRGVQISKIFAPEHGFRGTADAGATIKNGRDEKTGLPVFSLYGKKKKPSPEDFEGVDLVVFDIQDVGARFYTYISTLFYVEEACAEQGKPLLVLDRPNPNGHFVDGPVLEKGFESFIGIAPLPVVHGCTVGELARLFAGEKWVKASQNLDLQVIKCENYDHQTHYDLPVKPSPNLPDQRAVLLYPSLCFFEGTVASVGRGTDWAFSVVGHPDFPGKEFAFVPMPNEGNADPVLKGETCFGFDFRGEPLDSLRAHNQLNLKHLLRFYEAFPDKENFFLKNKFLDKLAGSDKLRLQILEGKTEAEIRESWRVALDGFFKTRSSYLLYP